MFKNFKDSLENAKQTFSCGICLSTLKEPRKCPNCTFMA